MSHHTVTRFKIYWKEKERNRRRKGGKEVRRNELTLRYRKRCVFGEGFTQRKEKDWWLMIFNDPDWFLNIYIDINKKFILERKKRTKK